MAKLLSSLPVGALVKDSSTKYLGKPIIFQVMEHGHAGDPAGSTALVTEKIICLRAFDGKEPSNSDSNRKSYGNNRYLHSNILQWLNSEAAASAWYTAKHTADTPPQAAYLWDDTSWRKSGKSCSSKPYDTEAGFLTNFSADLKAALMTVTKRTAKNTVTDGGGYEDVSSKIFLLSNTEVGLANENNVAEGSIYSLFSTSSNRITKPTPEAVEDAWCQNSGLSSTAAWYWWLRTPNAAYSYGARLVRADGSLGFNGACYGYRGVRPACAVSSSIHVSDTPDSDGAYVILWNAAPKITTDSEELGDKNAPFTISYSIKDPDGDAASAKLYLDSTVKETIPTVDQEKAYTYEVTASILNGLANGAHTIKIEAEDVNGNQSSVTISFNKTTSPVTISGVDGNIGNFWQVPSYTYQVDDIDTSKVLTVTESIDGQQTKIITDAPRKTDIEASFDNFEELSKDEVHQLVITATASDGATTTRTISFTKLGGRICFYTDAIPTDEAAKKIIVEVNYSQEGDPEIKVEVTNNALAAQARWEDMTEEFLAHTFYNFVNEPENGFGISVRVTVTKNENTERIYVYSLGCSFY